MNMQKLVEKISVSTTKQIEAMLEPLCVKAGLDKRMVSIYLPTGGLSYTIEHIASEIYLKAGEINTEIRLTLQLIDLGLSTEVSWHDLFRANEEFAKEDKEQWRYEDKESEIKKHRYDFIAKAQEFV
ncbi:MAG: hypothetical protein Q7R33_01020 [Nitrosarchaeum sp.]|nr:hypothetical protein [Nitrosarchaeum sp.]